MVQKRRLHHAVKTLHVFLSCSYEVPHSLAHLREKMASARRRARIVDLDVSNRPSNLDLAYPLKKKIKRVKRGPAFEGVCTSDTSATGKDWKRTLGRTLSISRNCDREKKGLTSTVMYRS